METETPKATRATAADLESMFDHAVSLQSQGELDGAAKAYRRLLALAPDLPEALSNLGAVLRLKDDLTGAEALLRRATAVRPNYVDAWHNLGVVLLRRGKFADSIQALSRALELDPGHAMSLAHRGQAHLDDGEPEKAVADWAEAARMMPSNFGVRNARGILLLRRGLLDEARAAFEETLAIEPEQPVALCNLGIILRQQEKNEEALPLLQRAVAAAPEMSEAHAGLTATYLALGRHIEAAEAAMVALETDPASTRYHSVLGHAIYGVFVNGKADEARALARRWIERFPDHPTAQHLGRAMAGEAAANRASDKFVQTLFNSFASSFDEQLQKLDYRAPQAIIGALSPIVGAAKELVILDAGCGTGLAGRMLRLWADELIGVDLSSSMLDKARERGIYDRLEEAELTAWLEAHPDAYDMIVAADVLCYFGELNPVIAAAQRALRPGGLLSFTVEKLDGPEEVVVGVHGRYGHAERFVRKALDAAGLQVEVMRVEPLRREAIAIVLGYVVVARRPA